MAEKNPLAIKIDIAPNVNSIISCLTGILSYCSDDVDTSYVAV